MKCPNCNQSFESEKEGLASAAHIQSGCLLAASLGVIIERESCPIPSDETIEKINVDWFWEYMGNTIDKLELHLSELEEE